MMFKLTYVSIVSGGAVYQDKYFIGSSADDVARRLAIWNPDWMGECMSSLNAAYPTPPEGVTVLRDALKPIQFESLPEGVGDTAQANKVH